jgi:hypothetical protein
MESMRFEYISDDDFSKLQFQPQPLHKAQVTVNGGMFIEGKYFGQCKFNGNVLTVEPYVPIDAYTKSLFQITAN